MVRRKSENPWKVRLVPPPDPPTLPSEEVSVAPTTLKVYGALVMAARSRKDGTDSALRVWHVGRQLNSKESGGSGVVSVLAVRKTCERIGWVFSRRHFRRMLADGEGLLWHQVSSNGEPVLRLVGLTNLACSLGIERIDWRPAEVPAERIRKLKAWRAAGYGAWLAGKSKHAPTISRSKQRQVISVPERTQRTYTTTEPSIRTETNFGIENRLATWEVLANEILFGRGHGFRWFDGRLARQLPNTYHVSFDLSPRGLCRKVAKQLRAGLLELPNSSSFLQADSRRYCRLFFITVKGAQKAVRRYSRDMPNGMPAAWDTSPAEVFGRVGWTRTGAVTWEVVR